MEKKTCKGCKRENSKNPIVVREFCKNCRRDYKGKSGTDFYERKTN